VGAGLTKSIALPGHPIPAMFDFIPVLADYVSDDVILATLVRLECADPYPYAFDSPQARELAQVLRDREAWRSSDNRSRFARALKNRPNESIEDLLERTSRQNAKTPSESANTRFRYAIRRLFTLIGWDVNWDPLLTFLTRQFSLTDVLHTFVSFNYDLVLDRALQKVLGSRFDIARIYGSHINLVVTGEPPTNVHGAVAGAPTARILSRQPEGCPFRLLKPHGSLNWFVSATQAEGPTIVPLAPDGTLRYVRSTETFQYFEVPGDLPDAFEPCLVTPTKAKKSDRRFLLDIRREEEAAIREADEIYILGWSLPRTDEDQEALIHSSIQRRSRPTTSLTVVNLNAGVEYFFRVASVFGTPPTSMQTFNAGFVEYASEIRKNT